MTKVTDPRVLRRPVRLSDFLTLEERFAAIERKMGALEDRLAKQAEKKPEKKP